MRLAFWSYTKFTGLYSGLVVEAFKRAFALDEEPGLASDRHCRSRGGPYSFWTAVTSLQDVTPTMSLPAFLVSFAGIVVVHELIHAAVHPMSGRSPHSIVGFWPSGGMIYAHYDGEMTRNRFVAILLMPLVVISFVPLLVAAVAQVPSGRVAFISAFNAFLACADILGAGLVLFQIPATAIVRQQGWRTYWREHESLAAFFLVLQRTRSLAGRPGLCCPGHNDKMRLGHGSTSLRPGSRLGPMASGVISAR